MVFRWTVWGPDAKLFELASYSVGTFQHMFGSAARYVVCTDQPAFVTRLLANGVDVIPMRQSVFDVQAKAPWRKWAPVVRVAPGDTEIYVDSDVFLISEPHELREFSLGYPGDRVLAMPESLPDHRMYGLFQQRIPVNMPAINTGLVGQQAGVDLSSELLQQFECWRDMTKAAPGCFHDEQGAVATVLSSYHAAGRLLLLPRTRYKIVSPSSNAKLRSLDSVALIHATWPSHPGFSWFRSEILERAKKAYYHT